MVYFWNVKLICHRTSILPFVVSSAFHIVRIWYTKRSHHIFKWIMKNSRGVNTKAAFCVLQKKNRTEFHWSVELFPNIASITCSQKKSQTCLFLIYANDIHVFQHQTSYPMSKWRRKRTLVWIYLKFTEFIWIIERWIQCTCVNDQFISSSIYIMY